MALAEDGLGYNPDTPFLHASSTSFVYKLRMLRYSVCTPPLSLTRSLTRSLIRLGGTYLREQAPCVLEQRLPLIP